MRAAAIAQEAAADVVIYGTLAEDGYYTSLAPRFYLATQYSALEPEFSTTDLLAAPIEYVRGDGMQASAGARLLDQRLRVIHHFLAGLSYFDRAQFGASRTAFESAIAAATGQDAEGEAGLEQSVAGVEILYVLAGNAALRENNFGRALELYGAALAARPGYARALVGRGYTLFQMALGGSPQACTNPAAEGSPAVFAVESDASATYDPQVVLDPAAGCVHLPSPLPTDPQRLGLLAERCYLEASRDRQLAAVPEIAAKIDLGLGQLYSWFALQGAPRWQDAAEHLQAVTRAYTAAPSGRQDRMSLDAGFAHAWLGLNRVRASPTPTAAEIQAAVMSYQTAVDLLENAIFRPYNQPCIKLYGAVIENLKQWLYPHTVGGKNK